MINIKNNMIQNNNIENDKLKTISLNEKLLDERNKKIDKIYTDVVQVNEIFNNLALLVKHQDIHIDNIENNVNNSIITIENGKNIIVKIDKKDKKDKKKRKFLCNTIYFCVILNIIFLCILIIKLT